MASALVKPRIPATELLEEGRHCVFLVGRTLKKEREAALGEARALLGVVLVAAPGRTANASDIGTCSVKTWSSCQRLCAS